MKLTDTEQAAENLLIQEKRCQICKHRGSEIWPKVWTCSHPTGPKKWPRKGRCVGFKADE